MTARVAAVDQSSDYFDLDWIKKHGVSNLHSLNTAVVRHSGLEFRGVNPALKDRHVSSHSWVMAWVRPTPEPDFWWVGVVEYGNGMVAYPSLPVPSEVTVPWLQGMGVTEDTRFRVEAAEALDHNPFDSTSKKSAAADRRSVYFIRAAASGLIKIGVAGSPASRLKALQTASPVDLTLIATIPGVGQADESRLHELFAEERVRGEWFQPSARLLAYVEENGVKA